MLYTIENEKIAVIIKSMGAELTSLQTKQDSKEVLWQSDPAVWNGQSPLLFPIVGRLLNDKYTINGREYTLSKHGFARNSEFNLANKTQNSVTLMLESNDHTKGMYPFDFKLYVTHTIKSNVLRVENVIENTGNDEMFFSIGGHPGFFCSIGDILKFEHNENISSMFIDEEGILTDKTEKVLSDSNVLPITKNMFDNDALILKDLKSTHITLKRNDYSVNVSFGKIPYLGLWAKPGANYVCIEPWFGINDSYTHNEDFTKKEGIVKLNSGGRFEFVYIIEV